MLSREDSTRLGAKRPPVAIGVDADRPGPCPRRADAGDRGGPRDRHGLDLAVEEVDLAGPPTSARPRAAGWAEAAVVVAGLRGEPEVTVRDPSGGRTATAIVDGGGIRVRVDAGDPLDEVVLRSYCIGAAHQGLGWVTSEGLAVDAGGEVHDLTIRSFGVLRAVDMVPVAVEVDSGSGPPVRGSDAVFAAVAGAVWVAQGCPPDWPTGRSLA